MSDLVGLNPKQIDGQPGLGVSEQLQQVILELKAIRMALTMIATEGGRAVPTDFSPELLNTSSSGGI